MIITNMIAITSFSALSPPKIVSKLVLTFDPDERKMLNVAAGSVGTTIAAINREPKNIYSTDNSLILEENE